MIQLERTFENGVSYLTAASYLVDGTYETYETCTRIPFDEETETMLKCEKVTKDYGYFVALKTWDGNPLPDGHYLGIWTSTGGTRCYDCTVWVASLGEAQGLAEYYNQYSFWDCAENEEVITVPKT